MDEVISKLLVNVNGLDPSKFTNEMISTQNGLMGTVSFPESSIVELCEKLESIRNQLNANVAIRSDLYLKRLVCSDLIKYLSSSGGTYVDPVLTIERFRTVMIELLAMMDDPNSTMGEVRETNVRTFKSSLFLIEELIDALIGCVNRHYGIKKPWHQRLDYLVNYL